MIINELLLNPNLAYVMLVVGGMIALLAIISPGTGILEIGALFILILAGWQVYNLPINVWAFGLLVAGFIPFIIALRKSNQRLTQSVLLAAAILAFVLGSSFLFRGAQWWRPAINPFLAALVSIASAGFIWISTTKAMEVRSKTPSHRLSNLIGATGESRTEIQEDGSAQIAGELWTVRSAEPIPANTKVRVVGREGFVLVVEAATPQK